MVQSPAYVRRGECGAEGDSAGDADLVAAEVQLAAGAAPRALQRRHEDLEEHGERVADHWKVPETLVDASKYGYSTLKYVGTAKNWTAEL